MSSRLHLAALLKEGQRVINHRAHRADGEKNRDQKERLLFRSLVVRWP